MKGLSWVGLVVGLLLVAGCSGYKKEMEAAKAKVQQLMREKAALEQQVRELQDKDKQAAASIDGLEEQCSVLRAEKRQLVQKTEGLSEARDRLHQAKQDLEKRVSKLERENEKLKDTIEGLKAAQPTTEPLQTVPPSPPGSPPAQYDAPSRPGQTSRQEIPEDPCQAMVQYMRRAGAVVGKFSGEERTRMLEKLEKDYATRLKDAPPNAVKAAKAWVEELDKTWDKVSDDSVFNLLKKKSAALKACNMTPEEAGF
jgi:chromosome segregation ATPase